MYESFSFALFSDKLEILFAEFERVGQIAIAHNLVGCQFFGATMKEDFPFKEQVGAVGDAQSFFNIVVGDENTNVAVLEFPDNILNVF